MLTIIAAALHVGGFVAAAAVRRGGAGWAEALVDICRIVHPAALLAGAATLTLFLAPLRWRAGGSEALWTPAALDAARRATYLLVAAYLALMLYLLAFGPVVQGWGAELGRGPYALLYEWVPPFRAIRAVGRIGLLWVLFAAALAGFALAALLARVRSRPVWHGALAALVLSLVVWEYRTWPLPHEQADPAVDPIYDWLAAQPGEFAVVHAPLQPANQPWLETRYMLGSTRHWKRLVNGYSGYFPPDYEELARAGPLTPEFFKLLRSDFPVRYLLVHDDWLANNRQHARLRRLLAPNGDAVFVEQVGYTYVFEVPRDRGRGAWVRRRFTAEQLRGQSGIQFLARVSDPAVGEDVLVLAGWGADTEALEVGATWQGARVEMPPDYVEGLDGGPGSFEIRAHELLPLGRTGALIASGFTADVQDGGAGVGLGATWFFVSEAPGMQVHTLERYGTRLAHTEEFPPTAAGAAALRDHIGALDAGTVVALTIGTGEPRALDAALIEGIGMVGGERPAGAGPVARLVVVGRKGASPGQALLHEDHKWAVIDIEAPAPTVELTGIGLY